MRRHSARSYLRSGVRLLVAEADGLLDAAERDGQAAALVAEADRRPGVTDVRVTVTFAAGEWEVHRPGFSHGLMFNYLDDLHPVDCEQCYCRHHRSNGRSSVLRGDPPSACRCGHLTMRHRFRQVRDTLEVCRAPETWFTDEMHVFNVLGGI